MYGSSVATDQISAQPILLSEYQHPFWYAAQTASNQERQVASCLQEKGVEAYVPLYPEARRRSDRTVVVQVPLFPGYVFVHIALRNRMRVLEVPRVVRLVGFGTTPAKIPDSDIISLQNGLDQGRAMPHPYLQIGRRVSIVTGPFQGMTGILVRRKSSLRVVVSIEAIQRAFGVEVDESEIRSLGGRAASAS